MIGPSRRGAQKVIEKKKMEIAENKFLDVRNDPEPTKFHDFAKEYLKWAKTNKKASTYSRYAHLSPKHKTRVINILDRVMSLESP